MVEFNPEEEKKGGESAQTKTGKASSAPETSVVEICNLLESCVIDAGINNIDFLNYLCDAALNLDGDQLESEKSAIELFTSEEFSELTNLVNTWKEVHAANPQKLVDFIQ